MKIINLMEDTAGEKDVFTEHGFCIYIESSKQKFLVDTGASEKTWENAKRLGIDISEVNFVFLSHGHYDHSGGILSFAEQNPDAKIYMHVHAGKDYYHIKGSKEKYIGIDKKIMDLPQAILLEHGCKINQEISVFSGVTGRRKWPQSNLKLKKKEDGGYVQDSFDHEQYIVVNDKGKMILISGCAHNGILNIIDRFRELYSSDPDIVISGFHMVKGTDYDTEEKTLIQDVAKELCEMNTRFYTGHCTGIPAFQMMKEIMRDKLNYMHSGDEVFM